MPIVADRRNREQTMDLLTTAYWMELETMMDYISDEQEHLREVEGFLKEHEGR
jgi:hypothetical protein